MNDEDGEKNDDDDEMTEQDGDEGETNEDEKEPDWRLVLVDILMAIAAKDERWWKTMLRPAGT